MTEKPQRLQLSRRKGTNLQARSITLNGLFAVNVARPTRWGNPYYPGCGIGYGHFDEQMHAVQYDVREPRVQVHWFKQRMAEKKRWQAADYEAYIAPLRGKNLACWCALDAPFCHADVLLELAAEPKAIKEAA